MFLTLLFAEHMLPWGLKLSYPWPFVTLKSLSFSKGRAQWGRSEPGKKGGQKEPAVKVGESKLLWTACCQSMGKANVSAPKCVFPPHLTHPATSHWPRLHGDCSRPLRSHWCQSSDWQHILKLSVGHCPALAMQKAQGCAQGPDSQHRPVLSRWSAMELRSDRCYYECFLLQNQWSRNAALKCTQRAWEWENIRHTCFYCGPCLLHVVCPTGRQHGRSF